MNISFFRKNTTFHFFLASMTYCGISFALNTNKIKEEFRDYDYAPTRVEKFYLENHMKQTVELVLAKKKQYLSKNKRVMGIWEAIEYLNELVDESDPDLDLPQAQHLFQTAEALRKDGQPDWLVLTGLIHDLGKILCLFGEEQWAVVGDTFPVGCAFSSKIVYPHFFQHNPDYNHPLYSTKMGIYQEGCGLDQVHMSWGHDEYLYHVVKNYLPKEALYAIRYHSFYAAHKEGAYDYLMNDEDRKMFQWVKLFNDYDLYSKDIQIVNIAEVQEYYNNLVQKYFPENLEW
jgi:inositol oxygenase